MVIEKNNGLSKFFSGVYLWMFIGLLVSGVIAYYTSASLSMINFVYKSYTIIWILELVVVIAFSWLRGKVSPLMAKILFITYAALNGLTLSSIFLIYKIESIGMVFLSSAIMFGLLAFYGYTTKTDLTSFGKLLLFGLLAIIIMSIIFNVNHFIFD